MSAATLERPDSSTLSVLDGQQLDGQQLDGQQLDGQELDGQGPDGQGRDGQELNREESNPLPGWRAHREAISGVRDGAGAHRQRVRVGDHSSRGSAMDQPAKPRIRRRRVRSGRGVGPSSQRLTRVRPPRLRRRRRRPRVSGCRVRVADSAPAASGSELRLTNRGIAVVLVSGAILAAAAITVITATALTVTSPGYDPPQSSVVGR